MKGVTWIMSDNANLSRRDGTVESVRAPRDHSLKGHDRPRRSARKAGGRRDGRVERSLRTRKLLIDAFIDLVRTTGEMPSAESLAARAGRSTRIVFDRFDTLDSLAAEAFQQELSSYDLVLPAGLPSQAFDVRLDWYVQTRARACEDWRGLWPLMSQFVTRDTRCAAWASVLAKLERERCERLFAPELQPFSRACRERLLLSLAILLSSETWAKLRDGHHMTENAAFMLWKDWGQGIFGSWTNPRTRGAG